jgi:hypothetical protein
MGFTSLPSMLVLAWTTVVINDLKEEYVVTFHV